MFGNSSEAITKMIEKGHWDKAAKKVAHGNAELRLAAAKACSCSDCDESYNILVDLLKDPDEKVQIAAIESLGKTAGDRASTHLTWIETRTPSEKKEIHDAIHAALAQIRSRH